MSAAARPTRADFAHRIQLAVRWGDMDALGHINNVKFFTYDEQVRLQYFDAIAAVVPDFWKSSGIILAKLGCDFIGQLRYPATLDIGFRISRLGRSSFDTFHTLERVDEPGVVYAEGGARTVWTDYAAKRSAPMPDWFRARLGGG